MWTSVVQKGAVCVYQWPAAEVTKAEKFFGGNKPLGKLTLTTLANSRHKKATCCASVALQFVRLPGRGTRVDERARTCPHCLAASKPEMPNEKMSKN
jgi:hypothetical protein